jgi:hypothetical protein
MPAPAYKRCTTCGERKPLTEFHRQRWGRYGRRSTCKVCRRAEGRAWRKANPERVAARKQRWVEEHPEKVGERQARYRQRHPDKYRARLAVSHAIRDGKLTKPDRCEKCGGEGQPFSDGRHPIHGHHEDYSKPLEVKWLCRRCHIAVHAQSTASA